MVRDSGGRCQILGPICGSRKVVDCRAPSPLGVPRAGVVDPAGTVEPTRNGTNCQFSSGVWKSSGVASRISCGGVSGISSILGVGMLRISAIVLAVNGRVAGCVEDVAVDDAENCGRNMFIVAAGVGDVAGVAANIGFAGVSACCASVFQVSGNCGAGGIVKSGTSCWIRYSQVGARVGKASPLGVPLSSLASLSVLAS